MFHQKMECAMLATEKGNLSVHTENIFPIIKKFLYSDHEIFLRELISNAIDASQKAKRLSSLGEFSDELGELKITVSIDKEAKTLTVSDKGIGMTADEIKKYINQIAFSGATEFIDTYKNTDDARQIIGHFGLGFYSAFMVSSQVEIISRSHKAGKEEAAHWVCDGSTTFTLEQTTKDERGTTIVLHIAEDSLEFLESHRVRGILDKYARFMPFPIEFEGTVINSADPIWTRQPSELKDEDYLNFYKELYPASEDPLFWIHLNVDYPFNLTGILYFPKLHNEFTPPKNKIQLYSRQVFITDEVRDIVPEFLMLLHGVIDSPDIPLNVSRSYLQSDSNVKKINNYITRKVADKLSELFRNDREGYQAKWDNIGLFVKFGMITDEKFYEKATSFALFKTTQNEYFTIDELKEKIAPLQTDKNDNIVALYAQDTEKQHSFIQAAQKRDYKVIVLDSPIDSHLVNQVEMRTDKLSMKRVDADAVDKLIERDETREMILSEDHQKMVKEYFEKALTGKQGQIQIQALSPEDAPIQIVFPEFFRRYREMSISGGMGGSSQIPEQMNILINGNHKVINELPNKSTEDATSAVQYLLDLGMLSQGMLKGEALSAFIERSIQRLEA